ncbi:MAG: mechanosensitive ion channel protein MscS [Arcobacter sp.]|nr:MAG: mechanosensitive ion channel protein MscS [Arcobacter sp.]
MVKRLLNFVFILFLFVGISNAEELNYLEKENNSWIQVYNNLIKTQAIDDEIKALEKDIKNASGQKRTELRQLLSLQESKKKILDELPKSFDDMLEKVIIGTNIKEINLIDYLFSNQKTKFAVETQKLNFLRKQYDEAVEYLENELKITSEQENKNLKKEEQLKKIITYFDNAKGLIEGKEEVLKRTKDLYINALKEYEQTQLRMHILNLSIIILLFILFYVSKYFITKKIDNEEKLFKIRKALNITFFVIILVVVIFFNIGNIIYAATLIGVIAAAMTISMKEYLQSMAAWFQLVIGGQIQIGDRILININNNPVIGEVIAISLFKTTLYESINNTTSAQTKIAGRIVFIANSLFVNNYVFNYTHDKMKTIYDMIELCIPFSTDTQKAETIAAEVAYEMTEKYMEVASKQFQSMRKRYDMRSREFRPRIHLIPDTKEPFFVLRIWYVAPYHQIMELKSQLSQKVVKRLLDEGISFYTK